MFKRFVSICLLISLPALASTPAAKASWLIRQESQPLQPPQPNPHDPGQPWILVSLASQTLTLFDANGLPVYSYPVSTSRYGAGSTENSYQTPLGWHRVCDKIGDNADPHTIIYHREVTPWRYTPELHQTWPDKDWILARILWLCGLEPGKNQGPGIDSHDRAIYIHGADEHVAFGKPTSRGCVRMQVDQVVDLYERVAIGTDVVIDEN